MKHGMSVLGAALLALFLVSPAQARTCGDGGLSGGVNTNAEPSQIMECQLWGRAFCRAAENRDLSMDQQESGSEVSSYLQRRMASTGSHLHRTVNWDPLANQAAAAAFALPDMVPGSLYYYAMYSCGIVKQLPELPAKRRSPVHQAFEAGAAECLQNHPPEGLGFPNPGLKECMRTGYSAALDAR